MGNRIYYKPTVCPYEKYNNMRLWGNERFTGIPSGTDMQVSSFMVQPAYKQCVMIMVCFYLTVFCMITPFCMIAGPTGMDLWQLLLTLAVAGSSSAFSGSEGEFYFPIPTPSVLK